MKWVIISKPEVRSFIWGKTNQMWKESGTEIQREESISNTREHQGLGLISGRRKGLVVIRLRLNKSLKLVVKHQRRLCERCWMTDFWGVGQMEVSVRALGKFRGHQVDQEWCSYVLHLFWSLLEVFSCKFHIPHQRHVAHLQLKMLARTGWHTLCILSSLSMII